MYHRHKLLRPSRTERRLNIGGDGTASGRVLAMARSVTGVGAKNNHSNNSNSIYSSESAGNFKHDLNNIEHSERQSHEDEPALAELLTEYRQQLSTIAMFFLKKSFKHVSILDGGFLGLVERLTLMISKKGVSETDPPHTAEDLESRWQTTNVELSALMPNSNMDMIHNLLTGKLDVGAESRGDGPSADIDSNARSTSSTSSGTSSRLRVVARNSVNQAAVIIAGSGNSPVPLLANSKESLCNAMDSQVHGATISSKDVEDMLSHYSEIAEDAAERKSNSDLSQDSATSSNHSKTNGSCAATLPLSSLTSVGTSMSNSLASLGGSVKRRFSIFGGNNARPEAVATSALTARNAENLVTQSTDAPTCHNTIAKPAFVIDDEDEIQPPSASHTNATAAAGTALQKVSKTESEKIEAIAVHRLNGLKDGDLITISKQDLPGTVLFPATKYRATNVPVADVESPTQELEVRFLVVSRERFLVLRPMKGTTMGVGGQATVVLNEHLTQLLRMTFRKRDPEMVTMYFSADGSEDNYNAFKDDEDSTSAERIRRYRVSKRAELVSALQKNMQRFK